MVCAQEEAEKEGLVDSHMLNGMLRVHTNSGRIEPAIRYYNTAFEKHGKVTSIRFAAPSFASPFGLAAFRSLKPCSES